MTAKVIPLVDQRTANRVPVIPAHALSPSGALADTRGRLMRDLRISVTDRCNFRCTYCMPKSVFGDRNAQVAQQPATGVRQRAAGAKRVRRNNRRAAGGALVNEVYYLGGHGNLCCVA